MCVCACACSMYRAHALLGTCAYNISPHELCLITSSTDGQGQGFYGRVGNIATLNSECL